MKDIRLLTILLVFIGYQSASSQQLNITNATHFPMDVQVFFSSHTVTTTVPPGSGYSYNLEKEGLFRGIIFDAFGKKREGEFISVGNPDSSEDVSSMHTYAIDIEKEIPTMSDGGSLVLSRGGDYLYDDKIDAQNRIKFGIARKKKR